MKIAELQDKKLPELKDMAKEMNLSGASTMRKQDLIYAILEARAEAVAGNSRRRESGPEPDKKRSTTRKPAARSPKKADKTEESSDEKPERNRIHRRDRKSVV